MFEIRILVSVFFSLKSEMCFLFPLILLHSAHGLINLDWQTLHDEVTIRYFSPDLFYQSQDPEEIWNYMGRNISCSVQVGLLSRDQNMVLMSFKDDLSVSVEVPEEFKPSLPFKVLTHGFASRATGDKTAFVEGVTVYVLTFHDFGLYFSLDEPLQQECQCHLGGLEQLGLLHWGLFRTVKIQ